MAPTLLGNWVMNVSLYQAAAAMNANARWQEMISENLAASSVPGFKRQEMSFDAIQSGLMPVKDLSNGGASVPMVMPHTKMATNFSGGMLKQTGVGTDVGLEGPGFFEVQLPNGERAFTRDGEFQLNASGQLVTKQGYPVLGEGGPIQLDGKSDGPISISPTGEISQSGTPRGVLKVSNFQNPGVMNPLGGGMFEDKEGKLIPAPGAKPVVRQGWIETANTTATVEMANLITAMRSFEANQRVVQMQDERMGRLISELGNPSN